MAACDQKMCGASPTVVCSCERCEREYDDNERFFSCDAHRTDVGQKHFRIRERTVVWMPIIQSGKNLTGGGRPCPDYGEPNLDSVQRLITEECDAVKEMLLAKNAAYGNSALQPLRVFSKADTVEQIKVRLDDKLSRLSRGSAAGEDPEFDIIGYLVLLRVHRRMRRLENDENKNS